MNATAKIVQEAAKNGFKLRGICQCCGGEWAVVKSGTMSNHGYTVHEFGWFQGVCAGRDAQPMQIDRSVADRTVQAVRDEVQALREQVAQFEAGTAHPEFIRKYTYRRGEDPFMRWEDAKEFDQKQGLKAAIFSTNRRIEAGLQFAQELSESADYWYGRELVRRPA